MGDTDSRYARAVLGWAPSDDLDVRLSFDVTRKRENSVPTELVGVGANDPSNLLLFVWNMLVAPTYGPGVV